MNKQLEQFQKQLENGRLAQSFLVTGPEKTGKFRAVVKMTGILNDLNDDQINLVSKGELVDIILIETELSEQKAKSKEQGAGDRDSNQENIKENKALKDRHRSKKIKDTITKKQIDSAMKNVSLKNFQLNKKVIIIKEANKMTNTAANSLLKLIEEPSDNLVIFLLINNDDNILATIKSRCQLVRFSFIDDDQINKVIQGEYSLDKDIIHSIVELSGGRIELAREYANNPKKIELAHKVRDSFRTALRGGRLEQIKLVESLTKSDEDLLWIMNEWIWYLKFFLEKNIQDGQAIAVIKKIHTILKNLLEVRNLIKTTNVSKKVQLENFFVQI